MKQDDIKEILINEARKEYEFMGSAINDKNPQVIAMYNQAKGAYDAIDNIHYKLFHNFIKSF